MINIETEQKLIILKQGDSSYALDNSLNSGWKVLHIAVLNGHNYGSSSYKSGEVHYILSRAVSNN